MSIYQIAGVCLIGVVINIVVFIYITKRKDLDPVPACKHEWELADMYIHEYYNGCDVDFIDKLVLYCDKCKTKRVVEKFEYTKMRQLNLIKKDLQK
jgi:hypothetical protein